MERLRERKENLRWVRFLLVRGVGLTFAIAFASLAVQIRALLGRDGILPVAEQLAFARRVLGGVSLTQLPTLFWWQSSDAWLVGVCWVGVGVSVLLMAGVAQRWLLVLLWAGYLSVTTVGGVFLRFQWDLLLLEAALTVLPLAPAALWAHRETPAPSRASLLLVRALLFKLMLLSGLVKLASGDPTWRELSAMRFHFWTQPLPALPGWWLAHAPDWLLQAMCALTLFIELVLPLGIWGPRRVRLVSFAGLLLLQLMIGLTGNYGFFNLLTGILCLSLLDDEALGRRVPTRAEPPQRTWALVPMAVLLALSVLVSVEPFWRLPDAVEAKLYLLHRLESVNSYGLFATMTQHRDEIRIQGSADGQVWKDYVFRDKPGPLGRAPAFVQPHMPRLDWQMWFAALGSCEDNAWLLSFSQALLENRPQVTGLLQTNPFAAQPPPRFVRLTIARYTLTTLAERRTTGHYWREGPSRPYCPTLTLDGGRLSAAAGF